MKGKECISNSIFPELANFDEYKCLTKWLPGRPDLRGEGS